jgi:hypothetical protein
MAAIWGELSVGPDLGSGRWGTASREVRPYGENGGAAGNGLTRGEALRGGLWGLGGVGPDLASGRAGNGLTRGEALRGEWRGDGTASHEVRPYGENGGATDRPHAR